MVNYNYVRAKIPGTQIEVEYNSTTQKLEYHMPLQQWEECVDHVYEIGRDIMPTEEE